MKTRSFSRPSELVVAVFLCLAGVASGSLIDDFVAGWTFDETGGVFSDVSGNGHHLSAIGSPHGDGGNGVLGGAMSLDGLVDAASNPDIADWGINNSFSISFWLKLDEDPRTDNTFLSIVGRRVGGTSGDNAGWDIRNAGPGNRGRIWVTFYGNDGEGSNASRSLQTVDEYLVGTNWVHIVMAASGGINVINNKDLYVNGVLVAGTSIGAWDSGTITNIVAHDEPFGVGKRLTTEGGHVAGQIDEMGLWNRKLTAEEVGQLYNDGDGISMSTIPEPSTLILLGLGSLIALRRRFVIR